MKAARAAPFLQLFFLLVVRRAYAQGRSGHLSHEIASQVSASAFCKAPDKPGRAPWSTAQLISDNTTYSWWKSQVPVPLQHSLPHAKVKELEWLYRHPLMLSESQIDQGIVSTGTTERMLKFCRKLVSGQPVSVTLLGGSWTSGSGVQNPKNSWASHLFAWIKGSFPNPDHVFINNATRGCTSGFVAPCLSKFIPEDVDLVVLEFDVNDGWHEIVELEQQQSLKWWEDRFTSPSRRQFERMLRALMGMQSNPAIIYMHAWEGGKLLGQNFYWGVEDKYATILAYYNLPSLSMRNSVQPLLIDWPEMHEHIWPPLNGHPTCLGTRLFADLLIAYLMRQCTNAVMGDIATGVQRRQLAAVTQPDHLPTPIFKNNDGSLSSKCFLNVQDMQQIITDNKGFEWTNEGSDTNPRWGYVAHNPQDSISVKYGREDFDAKQASMSFAISLLTSYEHMGMLEVACSGGCACKNTKFNTCKPKMTWSEVRWAFQYVEMTSETEPCYVQLTVSEASECKDHKLKILGLMLSADIESAGPNTSGLPPQSS